jgi:capsular polysaccharide transport system permease protein
VGSFARGLAIQAEVVYALILRETRTRFGAYRMGYLWALIEPVLMIVTFFVLFKVTKRGAPGGLDVWVFVASGIVPYNLFSHSAGKVAEAINGNKALLFYPHVFPLDLAIARSLLELVTSASVLIVLLGGHALVVQQFEIASPLMVVGGLLLAGLLGAALGLVFCGLGQLSSAADRARGPLLRPLFWMSGIFFSANALPDRIREVMLYNPVLHCTELVRGGLFADYAAVHARPTYVATWILFLALAGLSLERIVRQRIELS